MMPLVLPHNHNLNEAMRPGRQELGRSPGQDPLGRGFQAATAKGSHKVARSI